MAAATKKQSALLLNVPKEPPQRPIKASTAPSGGKMAKRAKTIVPDPMPIIAVPTQTIISFSQYSV